MSQLYSKVLRKLFLFKRKIPVILHFKQAEFSRTTTSCVQTLDKHVEVLLFLYRELDNLNIGENVSKFLRKGVNPTVDLLEQGITLEKFLTWKLDINDENSLVPVVRDMEVLKHNLGESLPFFGLYTIRDDPPFGVWNAHSVLLTEFLL